MQRLAIIDTETGGLDPDSHSLLSVSIVLTTERFEALEDFTVFIKQDTYHVTQKALATNQLDLVQSEHWTGIEEAKLQIAQFLKFKPEVLDPASDYEPRKAEKWRFIGKNPNFDRGFLNALFTKQVVDRMFVHWTECVFREMFLPLQRMRAFSKPASGALTDVCKAAGIQVDESLTHTSEYDCKLTLQLARKCLELEEQVTKTMMRTTQPSTIRRPSNVPRAPQ